MALIWFFLLSGLFLGWSTGANDASNIFGTAVASRMVSFRRAALIASIFVILGAVFSGAGTTSTLGALGAVDALAGAFTVGLAAAASVAFMTRLQLPVSTSQAVVGAIIGWNLFTGRSTDFAVLGKIVSTWVFSPVLAAVTAFFLSLVTRRVLQHRPVHLLRLDAWSRLGLIVVGAFGAYSLGANNIANVMGVFVPASPFKPLEFGDLVRVTSTQQLFLLGGLAIAVGIYTYSRRVMSTVGRGIFRLTPINALIAVFSMSLVLFVFASQSLERGLTMMGLPTFPLVPVSSTQAIVGAVIGVALANGGRNINYRVLGRIASGWITTPILAGIVSFVMLFFVQNVFEQPVVSDGAPTVQVEAPASPTAAASPRGSSGQGPLPPARRPSSRPRRPRTARAGPGRPAGHPVARVRRDRPGGLPPGLRPPGAGRPGGSTPPS